MRRLVRWGGFAAVALVVLAAGPSAPKAKRSLAPISIQIETENISAFDPSNPEKKRFGELEFRGGLVLRSKERLFGGISGLHIGPDRQHFVAHSDRGMWLRGKFVLDGDRVTGIADAQMAPMRGPAGRPLAAMSWYDTEALTVDGDDYYVGIERANQIVRFRFGTEGFGAYGIPIHVPSGIRALPYNRGLEALAFVPKGLPLAGSLLAISERGLDRDGNIVAFILGGKTPGTFAVRRFGGYQISDAAISPSGHLVLLERNFSILTGIHLRIRAVPLDEIRPNATVDGKVLVEAGAGYRIDNMEALAIERNAAGEILLTLISDDNFNRTLQRTILLRFAWPQAQAAR